MALVFDRFAFRARFLSNFAGRASVFSSAASGTFRTVRNALYLP
jgi:hypothetical protein